MNQKPSRKRKIISPNNRTIVDRIITFCCSIEVLDRNNNVKGAYDSTSIGLLCFQWKSLGWTLRQNGERAFTLQTDNGTKFRILLAYEVLAKEVEGEATCAVCMERFDSVVKIYLREHQINLCKKCANVLADCLDELDL